jgi:uncharacterized membrane protein YccF (DUF307 family)
VGGGGRSSRIRARESLGSAKRWAGYGWFMTFGTLLPLVFFFGGYVAQLTFVGAPARQHINGLGLWVSTFGQQPPGKDKLDARRQEQAGEEKPSFAERVRRRAPPGYLERRGKPVSTPARIVWFVLVGWWLGALWVLLSWSIFLAPYPFLDVVRGLLDELPSVMTLAYPEPNR